MGKKKKKIQDGRQSPEAQAAFARKAMPRVWTIDPTTKVVPHKRREGAEKHRPSWRDAE
jgi:hypothetical protein